MKDSSNRRKRRETPIADDRGDGNVTILFRDTQWKRRLGAGSQPEWSFSRAGRRFRKLHSTLAEEVEGFLRHANLPRIKRFPRLPAIVLLPGQLPEAVDRAEAALLPLCERLGIFQRAGELVRVVSLPELRADAYLKRVKGTIQLESLNATVLTELFNRIAEWRRPKGRTTVTTDCPQKIASFYLSRRGSWRVPVLAGIVAVPLLKKDANLLDRPGYDEPSCLYLASELDVSSIPNRPTPDDAKAALETLTAPFAEFPFVSAQDRSVHAAAILTAIQRPLLRACPLFGYSAPTQRSGKSQLPESVAIIAVGRPAAATAVSHDEEEIRKMITSTLREGHTIVNLDNLEHSLASPSLAKAITQSEYEDRALGTNRMLRLPTNVLWTATGNNLALRGDLAKRALLCRIDPRSEAPETRTFKISNLKDHLEESRADLIAAALTILRAYELAGRPRQNVKPWGGFEYWSASIREPLVWLGMADPCETRSSVLADDPEREESLTILRALHREFENDEFTVKRIMRHCESHGRLRSAIESMVVGRNKEIDSRKLGWWLRRNRNRITGGLRLESTGTESGSARWRIVVIDGGHEGQGVQSHRASVSASSYAGRGNIPAQDGTIKRFPRG